MAVIFTKRPLNALKLSISRPSKIYPNMHFWFLNIPPGYHFHNLSPPFLAWQRSKAFLPNIFSTLLSICPGGIRSHDPFTSNSTDRDDSPVLKELCSETFKGLRMLACWLPPFFPILLFGFAALLTGMTTISLRMQWTSDFSVTWQFLSKGTIVFFRYRSNSTPLSN
jgi:hypothetical protein